MLTLIAPRKFRVRAALAARGPVVIALKYVGGVIGWLALSAGPAGAATPARDPFPAMAPLEQYLMPREAEIALARSAGPEAVTKDAEVLVLGAAGYETAVPGHNGFVCAVQRAWAAPLDDPEFWNPQNRAPICWNAASAPYCVALMIRKTRLVLAGKSKAEIAAGMRAAIAAGEFPPLGNGAMCFMMAKGGHLNDGAGHWHPHLMFFVPKAPDTAWGGNLAGSPVFAQTDEIDHVTVFMVPVKRWSDGSPDGL